MRVCRNLNQLPRYFYCNNSHIQRNIWQIHAISGGPNFLDGQRMVSVLQMRQLWLSMRCRSTDKHNAEEITPSLSQYQAYDMIHKLTDQERGSLKNALNQYESDIVKTKFQGKRISS